MNKIFLLIIIGTFVSGLLIAQNITPEEVRYFNGSAYNGKIKIEQGASLENFIETHVGLNKKRRGFCGYRVKIYAQNHSNARSQANAIKINFVQDNQEAYVTYVEPNFEVHVGDFTNRFDAVALFNKVSGKYPEAYIIKTIIKYPQH